MTIVRAVKADVGMSAMYLITILSATIVIFIAIITFVINFTFVLILIVSVLHGMAIGCVGYQMNLLHLCTPRHLSLVHFTCHGSGVVRTFTS